MVAFAPLPQNFYEGGRDLRMGTIGSSGDTPALSAVIKFV